MLSLPSTVATRFSQHTRGTDETLEIRIESRPREYLVYNLAAWSFEEKPYPVGILEVLLRVGGKESEILISRLAVTKSGWDMQDFVHGHEPYSEKNVEVIFRLKGRGGMKELVVQMQ